MTDQFGNKPSAKSKVIVASNKKENHEKIIGLTKNYYSNFDKQNSVNNYKVCILAGGIGSRMGEFSKTFNKAMIPVQGKPSICHIIEKFPEDVEIVVIVGYKKKQS